MSRRTVAALGAVITLSAAPSANAQMQNEVEPNGTAATATALTSNPVKVHAANIYPAADVDFFSFSAAAGDRVYAGTMTSSTASSTDTILTLLASDGATVIETDDNDGVFGASASGIANATITTSGTYYLRVTSIATGQVRPYDMYVRLVSGTPGTEVEPNDTTATATPLPASGWVAGSTTLVTDLNDFYSFPMNAGDTVFLSLDFDPERDATEWNGQMFTGPYNNFLLGGNDAGALGGTPDSETVMITAKDAGTYFVLVGVPTAGTTAGTYTLSMSIIPAGACSTGSSATYSSTDTFPLAIPDGPSTSVSSTIVVPGSPRIGRVRLQIEINHPNPLDLDVVLTAPAGNDLRPFDDLPLTAGQPAGPSLINFVLDDEAALPAALFGVNNGMRWQPEFSSRLAWLKGENGGGTWTLTIRDDTAVNIGSLVSWSLEICEDPLETCPAAGRGGQRGTFTAYSNNFETTDGGFTHSGTLDEWEWGTPSFAPITTAYSGVKCWKTDLDSQYENSCNQNLLSPIIDLTNYQAPIYLRWAQKNHIESASFDHGIVTVQNPGGVNPKKVFEWTGPSGNATVGSTPTVTILQSQGWSLFEADISSYAGQQIELQFHVDTDSSVQFTGLAIDDVSVTACGFAQPCVADINNDGSVGVNDLLAVIGAWGPCVGCPPVQCPADIAPLPAGDCTIGVNDLLAVIGAWGACP